LRKRRREGGIYRWSWKEREGGKKKDIEREKWHEREREGVA